jgi:hypothetical protein
VDDAAFSPCFDLLGDGGILATLFYDEKPECAHASVDVEHDDGTVETVPGAEAGLDEDPVGWCLQFTDDPRQVSVVSRAPAEWADQVLAAAWLFVDQRIRARGVWRAAPEHRLWSEAEDA